jgi:formylglycine-generating enzyme required for sulfatase activity
VPDRPLKIYISHASEDQAAADNLFRRLGDDGFEPWLCEISVRASSNWREEMDKALQSADVFLFCVSGSSTSRYGQFAGEVERALELRTKNDDQSPAILPLRLDSSVIPVALGMFMAVDYFSLGGYERLLDALHNLVLKTSRYVFSIHGIRTRGRWQKDVVPLLGRAGFVSVPLDYGKFPALKLLFGPSRNKKVEWFRDEYTRQCNRVGATCPSMIAHSLGSYILAGAIAKYSDIKFDRIILCGAIVARSYPWRVYIQSGNVRAVLNQYGGNDFWARVVEWVIQDAGQSGLRGFDVPSPGLTQQYRPQFGHSDYFYDGNYRHTWIPFLQGSAIAPEEHPGPIIPNWRYMTTRLILLLLLIASSGAVAHFWIVRDPEVPSTKKPDYTNYVEILPGEFMMGCSEGDQECRPNEKPPHPIKLTRRFWMMRTEVTVGEFKKFVYSTDGQKMPRRYPSFNEAWNDDQMPIVQVRWYAAKDYCESMGGRLPTEAEWEYAARAGTNGARYGDPERIAWYGQDAPDHVAQRPANAFQLYDMLGNVWEWVNDRFDQGYYRLSPVIDPPGAADGDRHIARGGSWREGVSQIRVSRRADYLRSTQDDKIGFRCAKD